MSSGDEPSCSSAPNGIYYPGADEVKTQLKACLDGTRQRGTFAYKNICKEYPNPGLEIQNVGVVGLPMSSRDVEAVKQASHQAPFGKGSETIVDENVRKTWQIDASSVKFTNPRWDEWVQKHLPCEQLGVPSIAWPKVRAELYKILIYEPGAHFKQHQDSEKAPGMFATLAICLPTAHEGGELVLTHAGKQKVWKSSESSAIDLSIGAWYYKFCSMILEIRADKPKVLRCHSRSQTCYQRAPRSTDIQYHQRMQVTADGHAKRFTPWRLRRQVEAGVETLGCTRCLLRSG